ncbi:MAG: chemotaxis protein CheC [Candidatus Hermodarchaeota archaeon]
MVKNKQIKDLKLTPEQIDVLKEFGNIGSGNAITALSDLLNDTVNVSLTALNLCAFWKIPDLFEDPNIEVFGIYTEILDNPDLSIIQFFTKESIINLINILNEFNNSNSSEIKNIRDLNEFSYSIISEIGNLLAGHYASALADLLSIKLVPSVPKVALDNLTAMLNGVIAKYSQFADYSIIIDTKLQGKAINLNGIICLLPSINILNKLFKIVNLKFNLNL